MPNIIPFPPAAGALSVGALLARLRVLEGIESDDEDVMDTVAAEEQRVLAAIAATPAGDHLDLEQKLAALLRRAEAGEGWLDDNGIALLASSLNDLRLLARPRAVG